MQTRFHLPLWSVGLSILLAVSITSPAWAQDSGRVLARVVDQDSGDPVEAAEVVLDGQRAGVTDRNGAVLFHDVEVGSHGLEVSALGFEKRSATVETVANRTVEVELFMAADPVELDPVEVTVRSRWLEVNGFYRRMESGHGHHLTREEIEEKNQQRLIDLLRTTPGVKIISTGLGNGLIASSRLAGTSGMRRSMSNVMPFDVYIDNQPADAMAYNSLHPDAIEAIEVYQGAEVPVQYSGRAVMLIWTRGN